MSCSFINFNSLWWWSVAYIVLCPAVISLIIFASACRDDKLHFFRLPHCTSWWQSRESLPRSLWFTASSCRSAETMQLWTCLDFVTWTLWVSLHLKLLESAWRPEKHELNVAIFLLVSLWTCRSCCTSVTDVHLRYALCELPWESAGSGVFVLA